MKMRDARIELLRTAACFMVILIHIRFQPINGGEILKTTVLVSCFLAAAVGIFFLLAGAFLYEENRTIGKTVKRFLTRILAPALLTVFLTLVFEGWIQGERTLWECIRQSEFPAVWKAMKDGILCLSADYWGPLCGHLWYVTEYGKLILMFPFIVVLTRCASWKVLLYLAGSNLFCCVFIDLYRTFPMPGTIYCQPFLIPAQGMALLGFLLYQNREKLEGKKRISVLLLLCYLTGIVWMFWLQLRLLEKEGGGWTGTDFTTWLSGIGMITALLLTAFMLSLPRTWKLWTWIEKPASYLGRRSYTIYLIQFAVILKLDSLGVKAKFAALAVNSPGTLLYYAAFGLTVFGISLFIASVLHIGTGWLCAGRSGKDL